MYKWSLKKINLPFKINWRIHGGSATSKTNDFITVSKNNIEGWGEISASTKKNDIEIIQKDLIKIQPLEIQNFDELNSLNICPQVKAGLEIAWTNLQCKLQDKTLHEYLNIPINNSANICFSLPLLNPKDVRGYINTHKLNEYNSCKIKVSGLQSLDTVNEVIKNYNGKIRIDANESFESSSEVMIFLEKLKGINLEFIEQPLNRLNTSEAKKLKNMSDILIIGDESLQNNDVTKDYNQYFHGLNIKLMKAGGFRQAVKQLKQCKNLGLKTMIGCMIESSLNISAALQLGGLADWHDLDGFLFLEKDPFNYLNIKNGSLSLNN